MSNDQEIMKQFSNAVDNLSNEVNKLVREADKPVSFVFVLEKPEGNLVLLSGKKSKLLQQISNVINSILE